jgi:hypothetical protein
MKRPLLWLFQREVANQTRFALTAAEEIERRVAEIQTSDPTAGGYGERIEDIFGLLQSFLGAAANVSKLLWGVSAEATERREELRESLGVPEDSPLESRYLRDQFEHFDERLEEWARDAEKNNLNVVDMNLGPAESMVRGAHPSALLRNFDPEANVVTFRGETFELTPLIRALQEIRSRAESLATPERWAEM